MPVTQAMPANNSVGAGSYPQPHTESIVWVQGLEGAKAYPVAAGNNVLLMDSEASIFYIKSTDQSGVPQPIRIFDYSERTNNTPTKKEPEVEYVTKAEFDKVISELKNRKGGKNHE